MACDNDFFSDCKPQSFFSFVENQWVSQYREMTNFTRCLSSASTGITWREVLYDDGRRRYININSSVNDVSANRVVSVSSSDWVAVQCPDAASSSGGGLTNAELRATPVSVTGTTGNWTDRSGSITLSSVAQTVAASNTSRKYLLFQNPSDTNMYLNVNATAVLSSPSLLMAANGGGFEWNSNGFVPTGLVSVICSLSGKLFVCKEA